MARMKKNGNVRLAKIKKLLAEKRCSHILITDAIDAEYLCGFHSSNVFLLISRTRNLLFTDFRYKEAARAFSIAHPQWRFVQTTENGLAALSSYCPSGSVVGVQSGAISVDRFDALKKQLDGVRFVKLGDFVDALIIPKEAFEISLTKQAAAIGDRAFGLFVKYLKAGMTERQAARMLEDNCRRLGSEQPSFETIVLFGERTALPHGRPSERPLKKGDFILVDFGCTVGGFFSDMTRTVIFGAASLRQRKLYSIVEKAQQMGREAIREGVAASVVDSCARSVIEKAGYGEYFGHATGHGVGRRIHEKPRIAKENATMLPAGAIITVEPGIYIPKFGGVRIEDMVIVQKNGSETLTISPRSLIEVFL
jgi:Xaa-Pro aminopeptidase